MTYDDLPSRQKSQRLINRNKSVHGSSTSPSNSSFQQFNLYKQKAKNITSPNELLPGLNDISDAFEALPLDMIKYFTLLKEIDAKCINTVPQINLSIKKYIEDLHAKEEVQPTQQPVTGTSSGSILDSTTTSASENTTSNTEPSTTPASAAAAPAVTPLRRLTSIRNKILEIIPCLEEKMHVTSVATDLLYKHMYRINNDYKLIINNNEIPESIRIGPLNHPAMIVDSNSGNDLGNANRSLQLARSESRREAIAARRANKDDIGIDEDDLSGTNSGVNSSTNNGNAATGKGAGGIGKKKKVAATNKESTPDSKALGGNIGSGAGAAAAGSQAANGGKKRPRKEVLAGISQDSTSLQAGGSGDLSRPPTPVAGAASNKKRNTKGKKEESGGGLNSSLHSSNPGSQGKTGVGSTNSSGGSNNASNSNHNAMPSSSNNIEPTYCYCNQVSFGEMVGCDGDDCKREWFHLPCIGFKNPPKGKWYCDDCVVKMKKSKKV